MDAAETTRMVAGLPQDRLIEVILEQQRTIQSLRQKIEELRKQLGDCGQRPTPRMDEEYSLGAEEKRSRGKRRRKQKSERRGRRTTQEKLEQADRVEVVLPDGFAQDECSLHCQRPVWRIEDGRGVLVAYHIYRGPDGELPTVHGLIGRCEFGMEILVALGFLVFISRLSIDKSRVLLSFFWELALSKSQADALLNRLSREWEAEFDALCELLAHSAVVYADETSWSINSLWAFLSEKVRLLLFGVNKDAATLGTMLPKDLFNGVLVSDDAAVYRGFTRAQKCWAHLLRKAIKLTLQRPENQEYRSFLDGLLALYRKACRIQRDKRLKEATRRQKVQELDDELLDLCAARWCDDTVDDDETEADYRRLAHELMRLMLAEELFTFVIHPEVEGTNNKAERGVRDGASDRKIARTSKTIRGARRRTVTTSVLESLRLYLPEYTLRSVLNEVNDWLKSGSSRFRRLLDSLGLSLPETSRLDVLLPLPDG
jgi:hypothetical protein